MSRRWKITFALFVLGMGGLLGWVFRSAPNHGVTIRFMGYGTNTPGLRLADTTARFCLTNGSRRVIFCQTIGGTPSCFVETKTSEGWFMENGAFPDSSSVAGLISVPPGQATCFTLYVLSSDRPFRVTVPYSTNHFPGVFRMLRTPAPAPATTPIFIRIKNRVTSWFRFGQAEGAVSITIQDR